MKTIIKNIKHLKHKLTKKKKSKVKKDARHINEFRVDGYRVFFSAPYFENDLEYEIKWHENHLRKLFRQAKNPEHFHREFHEQEIDEDRMRHFKEHVIDSIPFHKKILDEHKKRFDTITDFITTTVYRKILSITKRHGGIPKYFAYDKKHHELFFISESNDKKEKRWTELVKERYKLAEVVVIGKR